MSCTACQSPTAEFFSPNGDALCKPCYYQGQVRAQEDRAQESLAAEAPPGFKVSAIRHESPGQTTRNGFILIGLCFGSTLLSGVFLDRVYLASGIFGLLGLAAFARALSFKRQARQSVLVVAIGIVLSLLLLFAILAVTILGV